MIRRLILRLDTATADRVSLADCAALAEALGAELLAEIEEDKRLGELAALGFMTEVCGSSAAVRPLSPERISRHTEQQVRRLSDELGRIARDRHLQWSLVRTSNQAPRSPSHHDEAVLQLHGAVTSYRATRSHAERPHLAVIDAGDDASARALSCARRIAAHRALPILLLALPDSPWHRQHLLPPGVAVRTDLACLDSTRLKPLLRAWHVQWLLIPASDQPRPETARTLGVPLLLIP